MIFLEILLVVVLVVTFLGSEVARDADNRLNETPQETNSPESSSNDETDMVD